MKCFKRQLINTLRCYMSLSLRANYVACLSVVHVIAFKLLSLFPKGCSPNGRQLGHSNSIRIICHISLISLFCTCSRQFINYLFFENFLTMQYLFFNFCGLCKSKSVSVFLFMYFRNLAIIAFAELVWLS